ncbi:MAG: GH92 family glycosyl hydrolase, partial [Rikenellaceae bacterium]|nr:GH92 family glycosyl hydrolase [Rikenellaceae bacterium]
MKKLLFILPPLCALSACGADYTRYVNPMVGTGGHGHTFPGAVAPYGMVQLSPDTRIQGWDACSGYHYSDSTIIGFSHTHLSGTGIGDYGDVLLMPTVDCDKIMRGTDTIPRSGYRSRFSHDNEVARPGYYSVMLDDYGVKAELTATVRAGMHRYTFPAAGSPAVVLDLAHTLHNHNNLELQIHVVSPTRIEGVKVTRGWAKNHRVFFSAEFSEPFQVQLYQANKQVQGTKASGGNVKALLKFPGAQGKQLLVKVGISSVAAAGAYGNVAAEIPGWDFDKVSSATGKAWNEKLGRIRVETKDEKQKRIFYTAYYHTMISPNTFVDADGRYRGQDLEIHTAADDEYYTIFSLWDTFRGAHPLLTLTDPGLNEAFVRTLLKKYDEGGALPMWDLASNYTGTMIGYHAVSVIVEAYMKGARNFDAEKAFEACVH